MRRILIAIVMTAVVAACGGSTAPDGPLRLGIISGNNQVVSASDLHLTNAVVGKMVRAANGTVSFRWSDAVLPATAGAQTGTVVTGSPVPGAIVCAVSTDAAHPLVPFVPCTNTDANGQATFFFTTSTKAGVAKAEIRGTLNNAPAVFDTAKATIMAEAADPNYRSTGNPLLTSPAVIPDIAVVDRYGNAIPFRIVSDNFITAQDTTVGSVGARTLVFSTDTKVNGTPVKHTAELRGAGGVLVGYFTYSIALGGIPQLQISWYSGGTAVTP